MGELGEGQEPGLRAASGGVARCPALGAFLAGKDVLRQGGGGEHNGDEDKDDNGAHAPHHSPAHAFHRGYRGSAPRKRA